MRITTIIGLILFIVGTNRTAISQIDTTASEEFSLVSKYKPMLSNSKRMEETPVLTKEMKQKPAFNYAIQPIQFKTSKIIHTLPPVSHKFELEKIRYQNYIKYGMGNLNGILGEVYLTNKYTDKYDYGVYWDHQSLKERKTVKALAYNTASLFGNVKSERMEYGANFTYHRRNNHFYGFEKDSIVNTEIKNLENVINDYNFTFRLGNQKANRRNYTFHSTIELDYFDNQTELTETNLIATFDVKKELQKDILLGFGVEVDNLNVDNTLDTADIATRRTNFALKPNVVYDKGKHRVSGAILANISNAAKQDFNFYIFPQFAYRYEIVNKELFIETSLDGDLQAMSNKEIYHRNPFVIKKSILNNEITSWNAKGKLFGVLGPKTNFQVQIGIKKMNNLFMFGNSGDSLNRFVTYLDDARIFYAGAGINQTIMEQFKLGLNFNLNNYDLTNSNVAFGLPKFELNINGQYKLGDKLLAKLNLSTIGIREQMDVRKSEEIKLSSYTDLSAKVEYFYKQFSIFIMGNNLLGKENPVLYNYDSYGFSILGGITARF